LLLTHLSQLVDQEGKFMIQLEQLQLELDAAQEREDKAKEDKKTSIAESLQREKEEKKAMEAKVEEAKKREQAYHKKLAIMQNSMAQQQMAGSLMASGVGAGSGADVPGTRRRASSLGGTDTPSNTLDEYDNEEDAGDEESIQRRPQRKRRATYHATTSTTLASLLGIQHTQGSADQSGGDDEAKDEDGVPTAWKEGDKVRVSKQSSQLGKEGTIEVPNWTVRLSCAIHVPAPLHPFTPPQCPLKQTTPPRPRT
jgi:hypothetical protein